MSVIELAPIVKTIEVRRSAADAFAIFTSEITAWWPKQHTRAKTANNERTAKVTIEPHVGGRVYETLEDGRELEWGEVTAFEPAALFAMNWRLGRPAAQGTDVSVRFEALGESRCRVTLTHAHWERLGDEAPAMHTGYANGWVTVFNKGFGEFAGLA